MGAVIVGVPAMKASSTIWVRLTATAKPLLSALTVGVAFAMVLTLKLEVASSETAPVEVSAPDVSTNARVLLFRVVAAMAAASVWGPAAVASASVANVSGLNVAPAGVEFAVVVIVPVAVACTSMAVDWVTAPAPSMNASVVTLITGIAVVVPTAVTAVMPSAVAATLALVVASTVTTPPALTDVLPERWLRAVLLMTGAAIAISPTPGKAPLTALASTVEFTLDVASARNRPDAVIVDVPVTATSADTFASRLTSGMLGRKLVTLDTSVVFAVRVMLFPTSVAPLTSTSAATSASGRVSGVAMLPSVATALSVMSPAVIVTPGSTTIFSALTVSGLPLRFRSPEMVTSSLPLWPLTIRSAFSVSAWISSRSVSEMTGIPRSAPRLIVSELVGFANVTLSKVGIASVLSRMSCAPRSTSLALSVRLLVLTTRLATTRLSMIGSRPAYSRTSPSRAIVPASGPVAM